MRSAPFALLVAVLGLVAVRVEGAPPASDRYGHMHMKYERTLFGVDVANVDVTFDAATRDHFRQIAVGHQYTDEIADSIARAALEAKDAYVQVQFLRHASLHEFLDAAHKNLERARDAGYITQDTFDSAWAGVQKDFARFAKRGFKKGDRLLYHATPDSLQTTVTAGDGGPLLDVTTGGEGARRAMLASYFAPGTDFRKGLINDLFR